MKRFVPIIIIIVLLLAAVLVFVHCTMSNQTPDDVSEPPNRGESDTLQSGIGDDAAEPGRLELPPDGNPDDSGSGGSSDDVMPGGNRDDSTPGGEPDNLLLDIDSSGKNVMLGTWRVEAASNVGEVSLSNTTMTFDEINWSVDGTVTVTVPGVLSFSEALSGGGTYSYDPADSMIEFINETYNTTEISHVEVIDENNLLITVKEYIGDGELLYDVYTLTRV